VLRLIKALPLVVIVLVLAAVALYRVGALPLPYKFYIMRTESMAPTIPAKSLLVVRDNSYKVGQVISFKLDGSVVTHRLIAINPNGTITTKGDANPTVDPWHVTKSSIIGGVVAAPRMVGFFVKFLTTIPGILWVFCVAVLWWQLWSYAEEGDDKVAQKLKA
jgi:signal peptidase